MNLHHSNESSIKVVSLCLLGVEHVHWMSTTRNGEDGLFESIEREINTTGRHREHRGNSPPRRSRRRTLQHREWQK